MSIVVVESIKSAPYFAEPLEESVTLVPPGGASSSSAAVTMKLPPSVWPETALSDRLLGIDGAGVGVAVATGLGLGLGLGSVTLLGSEKGLSALHVPYGCLLCPYTFTS